MDALLVGVGAYRSHIHQTERCSSGKLVRV
jgi:hypothetical protein